MTDYEDHDQRTRAGSGRVWDVAVFGGGASIVGGIAMVHLPTAVIVFGVLLLTFGVWGSRASVGQPERTDRVSQD
jgi:hypothetical protein